jgi:transcriptional regulator with XRE-family HTH domain
MKPGELLEQVRVSAGLSQEELARRAGTSRTTLSAYEHGRKSPTAATFARLLSGAGCELAAQPHVSFTRQPSPRGKPVWVPDRLPRLDVARPHVTREVGVLTGQGDYRVGGRRRAASDDAAVHVLRLGRARLGLGDQRPGYRRIDDAVLQPQVAAGQHAPRQGRVGTVGVAP